MLIFACILVTTIAVLIVAWNSRQLLGVFGLIKLEQEFNEDQQAARQLAYERGQEDEYDSLIAMEFIPLGVYTETYGQFGRTKQCVFAHRHLPVVCHLCINADEQLFVVLVTDDGMGRFVRSSTCIHCPVAKMDDFIGQLVEAEFTEEVLAAHMQTVAQWEQDNFHPVFVKTMQEASDQCLNLFNHREIQKVIQSANKVVGSAPILVALCFPAFLSTPAWLLLNGIMKLQLPVNGFSILLVYSAISIVASLLFGVHKISKNPQRNSLGPKEPQELQPRLVEPGQATVQS